MYHQLCIFQLDDCIESPPRHRPAGPLGCQGGKTLADKSRDLGSWYKDVGVLSGLIPCRAVQQQRWSPRQGRATRSVVQAAASKEKIALL